MNVSRIYTRNLIATQRSSSLQDAAALMRLHHVGAILVTDDEPNDDRAIGIVTDRDFVVEVIAEGISPGALTVGDVMTRGLLAISETCDLHEAIETMRSNGIRRLAVKDDKERLVGVLSFDDVVDALAVELSSLSDALRRGHARETVERGSMAA